VAGGLRARGVTAGSKVAVYSPNDVIAFVIVIGVLRAGATWVAVNPRAKPAELAQLLDSVGVDLLIHHESLTDAAADLTGRLTTLRDLLVFSSAEPEALDGWLASPGTRVGRAPLDPDGVAMIMGSGGTTGTPKAVPITNRQYLTMSLAFNAHMPEPAPPVYLMATPMTHAAGVSAWPVLAQGGRVVVHDGVHAEALFESVVRNRATRLFLPPTAIYTLLSHHAIRDVDFGSLRHFIYAAAPMSAEKLVEAMDVFGAVMTQTYGQAEAPMICTCLSPAEHAQALRHTSTIRRLSSCGRPSVVAAVAIMGDDGELLGAEQRGEIVVRGDLVMRGYYNNPRATAEVRRPGGWHGTGDVGFRDEDGFVYIVDRKRDLIITGGFNVYPSDVERVIWSHSSVLDCAVIGLPDDKWGEAVTAVVEMKDGQRVSEGELIALCKSTLGSVQAPKRVLFRDLPRSANGKVLRRALRDEYWAGRARMV
jgi:acyl-CoA synthetase (AMP-forming)/AMP-acid ligase II